MRGIKFLAGLGTILIFIGIFCFKGLRQNKNLKEGSHTKANSPNKFILILAGILSITLGVFLLIKAISLI